LLAGWDFDAGILLTQFLAGGINYSAAFPEFAGTPGESRRHPLPMFIG
jgi:hypothetical protein